MIKIYLLCDERKSLMDNAENLEILSSRLPFWGHLDKAQQDLLLGSAKQAHYAKGQMLNSGGNGCGCVLLVLHGILRAYITSDGGREVSLYRLEDGDACTLSASCIMQTIDFDLSFNAETDCRVLQIGSSAFSRVTAENVYAELFCYKTATERFSDVMWAIQQILFTSFDKRLAAFLLQENARNGNRTIRMTHEQIARYLGSAREVVSRMLKYFSSEGYVTLSRGGITVVDEKRLRKALNK